MSLSVPNRTATGTIFNNNTEVSVSVSPGSVVEDGLVPLVYTFTRIGVVAGTLTTNFTVGGSAAALSDYSQLGAASFTAPTGTVVFASGNFTATVTITPTVDSNTEFDETVVLNVAAGAGYAIGTTNSATGTIRDDDAQISLSVSPSNVAEDGATNLAYTFNRVGSTSGRTGRQLQCRRHRDVWLRLLNRERDQFHGDDGQHHVRSRSQFGHDVRRSGRGQRD